MLVAYRDPLRAVDILYLVDQRALDGLYALDLEKLLRIEVALGQLCALVDLLPLLDQEVLVDGDVVGDLLLDLALSGGYYYLALALHHAYLGDLAVKARQKGHLLRTPDLEELLDARQTLGDVLSRETDASGVEGAHRELRARLSDRLGGDHSDRLAKRDFLPGGKVHPVAHLAYPVAQSAAKRAAHVHRLYACGLYGP